MTLKSGAAARDRSLFMLVALSCAVGSIDGDAIARAQTLPVVVSGRDSESRQPSTSIGETEQVSGSFRRLFSELQTEATKHGLDPALIARIAATLEVDPEVLVLSRRQPELVLPPWSYIERLVTEDRIAEGQRMLSLHAETLKLLEDNYGVPGQILVAIWGVETNFGRNSGSREVIRSLATLAAAADRRREFWRSELVHALRIVQSGAISAQEMTGSWAGAMGHTQFMPSSYSNIAVDLDGDGRRDIWRSIPDALGSTAAYLRQAGWRTGSDWGCEVELSQTFDLGSAYASPSMSGEAWRTIGASPRHSEGTPDGRGSRCGADSDQMRLVLPAGRHGPAFVVNARFDAIMRYNNSVPYALAVALLADRLVGAPEIAAKWPIDDPPIGRAQIETLQRRLAEMGFAPGPADGVLGAQTRAAVRAFQRRVGRAEDGYAGAALYRAVIGEGTENGLH